MASDILSLSGNLFTFNGKKCECKIETTYTQEGAEIKRLRIREIPNANIRFAYMPGQGLVSVDLKSGAASKENILSELVSIKIGDISNLSNFFEKYGFWIPLTDKIFDVFDAEDIFNIHKHIVYTIKVLTMLQQKKIDYLKLYSKICWLTFTLPVQLKSTNGEDNALYQTCIHNFLGYMNGTIPIKQSAEEMEKLMYEGAYDNPEADFKVQDSIRPPFTTINEMTYIEAMEEDNSLNDPTHYYSMRPLLHPGRLMSLFRYATEVEKIDRFVIEYFYHMETEIGQISSLSKEDELIFYRDIKDKYKKNFDEILKKATIKVAKQIVKEEIDFNLSGIAASYNVDTMSPSWNIPDLMTALFFSIFYMKPNLEVYRKCENPSCTRIFLVSTTNSRRKYCSPECANSMAQRMYRKRKKASI